MSAPRQILPGITYLLTRRCFGRRMFLKPGRKTNQIFKFCLAVAAARTGVLIHAFCVLGNHYHIVATDVHGNLPVFMHWLNEYVAKCINTELGRWESFWAPGSYSAVTLADREAVLGALVYTYTNPVDAGLVDRGHKWPGAMSTPAGMVSPAEPVERPTGFFRETGSVPEVAAVELCLPSAIEDCEDPVGLVQRLVAEREVEIRARFRKEGRRFLGVRKVLAQSARSKPGSREPRRALNPRVAAKDKWRRIEALQRLRAFLHAYRAAWRQFAGGDRSAVFPYGTYAMRMRFGVFCSGP